MASSPILYLKSRWTTIRDLYIVYNIPRMYSFAYMKGGAFDIGDPLLLFSILFFIFQILFIITIIIVF